MGHRLFPAGATKTDQVSVGATATLLAGKELGRRVLKVVNMGTEDVFIGDENVTTSNGYLLVGTKGAEVEVWTDGPVYAVAANAVDVGVLQVI